jgi:methylated-DNA-[protein]-cysteine S-methyltransferase
LSHHQTYYKSPLGWLQLEATDTALTKVHFTDLEEAPAAAPEQAPHVLTDCVQQLQAYFDGQRTVFDLPLAPPGTAFQQKVWNLLLEIPFAKQVSYMDMAKRVGDVKAIRAAASANGKNPIGIIIPCHRVVGSNQSLTGYAGGLWRKKWLLEHEARIGGGLLTLF